MKTFLENYQYKFGKETRRKPTFYKDKDGKMQVNHESKWLDYVEWATVLVALYKQGAKQVTFLSELHEHKPNTLRISVTIDGEQYTTDYPIIDGNSVIKEPNQMNLHRADVRGFVKCVAIHTGLGLSLWQKEESILNDTPPEPLPKKEIDPEKEKARQWLKEAIEGAKTIEDLNHIYKANETRIKGDKVIVSWVFARKAQLQLKKLDDELK